MSENIKLSKRNNDNPYLQEDLIVLTFILTIIAIISAFTPYIHVTITSGIVAGIFYVGGYINDRLIDIRLAIQGKAVGRDYGKDDDS